MFGYYESYYLQQMIENDTEGRSSIWEYLNSYKQLNNPNQSKVANRKLLQIENSQEAWAIAHELLASTDPQYCLHGAQLLSKKLNVPPTPQTDLLPWLPYLNGLAKKSSLVWLCMAKILVHMSPKNVVLPGELDPSDQLRLLREIPAALSHVRTKETIDVSAMKKAYLDMAVPLILSQHKNHSDLILQVIDAFVSYGTKVSDQKIIQFLLAMPFQDGGHILEQTLGRQKYPELQTEIFSYLQKNSREESAFSLFVTFFKQIDISTVSKESLNQGLSFILSELQRDDGDSRTRLSDSYELWFTLAKSFGKTQLNEQVKQVICKCLFVVWKITCKRSILSIIPEITISKDTLEISEQPDSEGQEGGCPENKGPEIFRDYAGDFFVLVFETLAGYDNLIDSLIKMVEELALGQLLHLQLAIYIVASIAPAKSKAQKLFEAPLRAIFGRSKDMTQYVCSRVVALIGELGEVLVAIPDLLAPALLFLTQSILYQSLAPIASTSLSNLLQQIKIQETPILVETMQLFLSQIFQVIFGVNCSSKVVEHLIRSMTIFVYKVRHSPSAYTAYLGNFGQRCIQMPKEAQPKMIEAAVFAQLWINSRQQIRDSNQSEKSKVTQKSVFNEYMVPFANFMEQQAPLLLWWVENSDRKQVFTQRVSIISTAFRTNSLGSSETWIHLCDALLTKYLEVKPSLPAVIAPLSNLTRAASELKIEFVAVNVFKCLKKWHRPISQMLDFTYQKCDFSMTCAVVTLHLRIVQLVKVFPQCVTEIDYKPQIIVDYLTGLLLTSEIWEYQIFKFSLQYLLIVVQLGYPPLSILTALLKSFGRLQESLWTSLDPLLFFIYKQYGFNLYQKVLEGMESGLADLQNPLSGVLKQAFDKDERRTVKNLFLSLQ